MKEYYISINGIIETDLSHQEFLDKFILWIESNGYRFCGSSREVDEEGNPLEYKKSFIDVE
jgi:effector-binding domain-containing protein